MEQPFWEWITGEGALIASAVHDGHALRAEAQERICLDEAERLREEDPYTAAWAALVEPRIRTYRSRFEVDLNRPPEQAVYLKPEDSWGLKVWREPPEPSCVEASLASYADFYSGVEQRLREIEKRHGFFVLLDLHTYNHRRAGADQAPADPEKNPEINIGTASCRRELWGPLIDRFMADLRNFDFQGRSLDVRENVKFLGGNFPRWIHRTFPQSGLAIAVEFKKIFMDEWTGELNLDLHRALGEALASTFAGLRTSLQAMGGRP
ncbi:MAG TPA: N-formylglutamate amidohydrolase, partial [bacterium]|nr:N-formylglutamate amidohydrolase [bacterium]